MRRIIFKNIGYDCIKLICNKKILFTESKFFLCTSLTNSVTSENEINQLQTENLSKAKEISTSIKTKVARTDNKSPAIKKKRNILEDKSLLNIHEIFTNLRKFATAKFDETVDIVVKLGVDPRKASQAVKGVASLPFGTGKKIRICVFATGDDAKAAQEAGADIVGSDDLIKSIQEGIIEFDRAIATPEMMSQVGKIGKILGPKGLMPNPRLGTVTKDIAGAVRSAKAGSVQFRVDKQGYIQAGLGKISFTNEHLLENIKSFMISLLDVKPEGLKGKYIQAVTISSTMGPGLKVDVSSVDPASPRFMLDKAALKRK